MEITRGKLSQIWCTIEHIKQHHEDYKHKSLCLTPSLFLDFTYNPRHKLELDFWEFEKHYKQKL
jgi:hypothetical protein